MNRFTTIFITLFSFIFASQVDAQQSTGNNTTTQIRLKKKNNRPGMPSNQFLTIYILEDKLSFEFPDEINFIDISIKDGDLIIFTDVVDKETPSITLLSEFHGEYEITCRTDDNQVFGGLIEIP